MNAQRPARPPRLALRLLEAFLPVDAREAVIGDVTESWARDVAERRSFARLRFWRETIQALFLLQTMPEHVTSYTPATRESWTQSFMADLRHAIRGTSRAPGFALLSTATLGVAIGASTALLSIANPLLFQVVPYAGADRLVIVNERATDGGGMNVGYPTYLDLRNGARSLERSAAYGTWEPTMFAQGEGERLRGLRVTWEFFRTLGVQPVIGRDFLAEEDVPDRREVVILSHGLWQRRYAADPGVIGGTMDFGTVKATIVGVLPASFENVLDPTSQAYRVLGYVPNDSGPGCRSCRHLRMVGRVRSGVSRGAAQRDLDVVMQRMAAEHPTTYRGKGTVVEGMAERATKGTRAIFLVTIGAVALLLLIAAANVVNLQLARAARREEEFAVRAALGAGRGRIARQLLAEGLLVAVLGGLAGVALAAVALPSLVAQLPATLPRLESVRLDWQVLAVAAVLVMLLTIAIGLIPSVHAGKRSLMSGIRAGGARGGGRGLPHHRTRAGIVVAEVALAMMLVIGAALLGRTLLGLLSVDLGFDAEQLVTMSVQEAGPRYDSAHKVFAHHDAIREAVMRVPGVTGVGLTSQLPLGGNMDQYGIRDRDNPDVERGLDAERYAVSADYMKTMKIRIVRGRPFEEQETRDTAMRVVIVSDAFANRMWPGSDPLDRYVSIGGGVGQEPVYFRVIGVAAATQHAGLDRGPALQIYVPERHWRWAETTMTLVARVSGDPRRLIQPIISAVRSSDPLQPVLRVATMEQVVTRSIGQRRLGMLLFVSFSAIALLLAAAGIYGVLSGAVTERTREFGVRAAFGATPAAITGLVLREGAMLTLAGLAIGGAGALVMSRYLRALLYGVDSRDPVSIVIGVVVIALVALAACVIPARRATSTDPVTALRAD